MIALYGLFLSTQVTRARLLGLLALGSLAVVLGYAIGASAAADPLEDGTRLIANYGLNLFVPVTSLVFASSVLGDPNEDGTLVYLWLRPVARWRLALAALAATLTVTLPVVVVPMVAAAALTGAGQELLTATVVACTVAVVGYSGVFTWLGLRVKRALVWGLAYVLIWEGFVARAGDNPSRLAIQAHARSVLTHMADGPPRLAAVAQATGTITPVAVAVVATLLTIRRLRRQDVA